MDWLVKEVAGRLYWSGLPGPVPLPRPIEEVNTAEVGKDRSDGSTATIVV